MKRTRKYWWGLKYGLRQYFLWYLVGIVAIGIARIVLGLVGTPGLVVNAATVVIAGLAILGFVRNAGWPTEADVAARTEGFDGTHIKGSTDNAAKAIESLDPNRTPEYASTGRKLTGAIVGGTRTPGQRERVLEKLSARSDVGPPEVFDRLFGLYDHLGDSDDLLLAIEEFVRMEPSAAEPHTGALFDVLRSASKSERERSSAALALAHISRTSPGVASKCTDDVASLLGSDDVAVRRKVVLALGELAARDERAIDRVLELAGSRVSDIADVARDIVRYYDAAGPGSDPYPAGDRLDELEAKNAHSAVQQGSGGGGFEGIGYQCERCGAQLYGFWDIETASGHYACSECGHELDDQIGAGWEYWEDEEEW